MGLFGVKKLKIKEAVQSAKVALCSYFNLKDWSVCRVNIDKSKKMGCVEANYGNKTYIRVFLCNPLKKGELPFMTTYYAVRGEKADASKLATFNQRYFYFCVNAPYGNEIQFMHVDQMMHNEFVGMAVKKALAELFTDSMKKKAKEVTASVDL